MRYAPSEPVLVATVAGAVAPALLYVAGTAAALLAGGAADAAAPVEDLLLAQPATNSATTPSDTVACIAADGTRITFFILNSRTCVDSWITLYDDAAAAAGTYPLPLIRVP